MLDLQLRLGRWLHVSAQVVVTSGVLFPVPERCEMDNERGAA